jgi:hypothetical protein
MRDYFNIKITTTTNLTCKWYYFCVITSSNGFGLVPVLRSKQESPID